MAPDAITATSATIVDRTSFTVVYGNADGVSIPANIHASFIEIGGQLPSERPLLVNVPSSFFNGGVLPGPGDAVYELYQPVQDDNLVIYRPYDATLNNVSYPTIIAMYGMQSLYNAFNVLDLATDFADSAIIAAGGDYNTRFNEIKGKIDNYITTVDSARNVVLTGHSLGGKMMFDYFYQTPHKQLIEKVSLFNPYMIADNIYQDVYNIMIGDNAASKLIYQVVDIHIIIGDVASALVEKRPICNLYRYPTQLAANDPDFFHVLSGVIFANYLTYENHKLSHFSDLYFGSTWSAVSTDDTFDNFLASHQNSEKMLLETVKSQAFIDEDGTTEAFNSSLKLIHTSGGEIRLDWLNTSATSIHTYYEWLISIDLNKYLTFNLEGALYLARKVTLTNAGSNISFFVQRTADTDRANYILRKGDDNTIMYTLKEGQFNDIHGLGDNFKERTYASYVALVDADAISRGKFYFSNTLDNAAATPQDAATAWHFPGTNNRRGLHIPTQITQFELTLGLGSNSGLTNFNTYLISKGACYQSNNADSTERFILLDTNGQYYAYPSIPATAPEGIQGLGAAAPDTEVWNISYDTVNSSWNISNTGTTTNNRLYKDISNDGAGSTFLWEQVSGSTSYNYAGMVNSDFPYTNTNLQVINNGDGYYQLYVMYGTVKMYLFVQQNPFSNTHTYNYGFLTLIAETNIDSTKIDATKFKIANNVNTGSGIP